MKRTTCDTLDASRSHSDIAFENASAEPLGKPGEGWSDMQRTLDRAAILLAFEQVGGADVCLALAKDYALNRYAFGRPIASFQAIKHKLADMYVNNELARSNAYYGAWALSTGARELPLAAAAARVSATQAFDYASKENIQTHGGIGFTWAMDLPLLLQAREGDRPCARPAARLERQACDGIGSVQRLKRANSE
ncbi:MAG: acyl-CoA dehydrogenase family protein [Rhizomicrobium sp.]